VFIRDVVFGMMSSALCETLTEIDMMRSLFAVHRTQIIIPPVIHITANLASCWIRVPGELFGLYLYPPPRFPRK
jgi:hypothetical protein